MLHSIRRLLGVPTRWTPLVSLPLVLLVNSCAVVDLVDAKFMNPVALPERKMEDLRKETLDLHRSLLVADLHADTLMLDRGGLEGIQKRHSWGHADGPRLQEGNVALQVLTVATDTPVPYVQALNGSYLIPNAQVPLAVLQGWPVRTWFSNRKKALYQAWKWRINSDDPSDLFVAIRSQADLRAFLRKHFRRIDGSWQPRRPGRTPVATVLGLEGAHALELGDGDDQEMVRRRVSEFREAGFRIMALTHRFDNEYSGASEGREGCGVTPLGHLVLREMVAQGIICDLSHASDRTIVDILDTYPSLPVLVSHGGVAIGEFASPRTTDLNLVRRIAARGGLFGVGIWAEAIREPTAENAAGMITQSLADEEIGPDHVCLGSDMDGSVKAAFAANHWALLTDELRGELSTREIRKVMGGNVIDFLLRNLPAE